MEIVFALLVLLLILGLLWCVWWVIGRMGLPQPFRIVALVLVAIVVLVLVLRWPLLSAHGLG